MKTVGVGVAVYLFSAITLMFIIGPYSGVISIIFGIAGAFIYRRSVDKSEKEKAQTELIFTMRDELIKLRESAEKTTLPEDTVQKVERERLSHKAKRDKEKSHIARLNEAVKAAEELNSRTSKPQAENEDMKGYRENMQRQMDDALSAAEELRKKQGED